MSDTNLRTNSNIELSDIRKLDILLTQCESDSCENICIDCCAKLGSVEDDDDDENANDENGSGSDSLIIGNSCARGEGAAEMTTSNEFTSKLRHQRMADTKMNRSIDKNDVISNVPAILSTSASPLDVNPPVATTNATAMQIATTLKRHGGLLQKSIDYDHSMPCFENNTKTFHPSDVQYNIQNLHSQIQQNQYSRATSYELTYCKNCGGLTTSNKQNLTKKQYFSLDKERHEKANNNQQCNVPMNRSQCSNSESENMLSANRKQCSFDGGNSEKSFGKLSQTIASSNNKKTLLPTTTTTTSKPPCDRCVKSPPSKKSSSHRSDGCTSLGNRSLKDKSNKSSQNSLKESRAASRKNSIFFLSSDRDSSQKSKRISQQYSRKQSTRGIGLNLHEEQDAETREILLGSTSHSTKFPVEIKIPEPVEAVCCSFTYFTDMNIYCCL